MKLIKITDKEFIGGGGNWKVYKGNLQNGNDNPIIIKTNDKINERKIDGNIKNFELTKSLGLPTLKFYEKAEFENNLVIVAENLNNSSSIYVSPNSVKTIQHQQLEQLNGKITSESVTEQKLYNEKISSISNLLNFIINIKIKLSEISAIKIVLEYDSYFLGISNQNILDYKIADFDTIFKCDDKSIEECSQINIDELKRVLTLFIKYFVVEKKQSELLDIVNNNMA